jgi:2-oxoglutarate dehydrogenase E1 component
MDPLPPSSLYSGNAWFIEEIYELYLADPQSVDEHWRAFFASLPDGQGPTQDVAHSPIQQAFAERAKRPLRALSRAPDESALRTFADKQVSVLQLINAYRFRGHRQADLDPLRQYDRPEVAELDPAYHGLDEADLNRRFNTGSLHGPDQATLEQILEIVRTTYCSSLGAEYMHITETAEKRWIQAKLEPSRAQPGFDADTRRNILDRLVAAGTLEEYLHKKYVGQKRFSLEGGESLIPLLDTVVQGAGTAGVDEVVIGMAHRGRLNVLVNILGKHPGDLFDEFEGKKVSDIGSGDVKYHLGYSSDIQTPGGTVHLTLSFNPSHLEIIDPVVEGSVRARQDRRKDKDRSRILPILIHGDAAFSGQGVVMETLQLSQTRGYSTGGTVHVVVNNQIGFTTSDALDSRSTLYCTDVAKMIQAPILHVNADDPEAVVMVASLALAYRTEFKKDVVIDLVCFRRYGHSEADEPSATQPVMYQKIRQHPTAKALYAAELEKAGVIKADELAQMEQAYIDSLENNAPVSRPLVRDAISQHRIDYTRYKDTHWDEPHDTSLDVATIERLAGRFNHVPKALNLHRAVSRILESRIKMAAGELACDWGFCETRASASLVAEGHPVRLSGQDSGRGTFFHRHAVIHDQDTGLTYLPLQNVSNDQADFLVINSILSEEAVLGFDFGYSSAYPEALVIWEAQFGDFANGAQVVIDQFIASCEAKWGRHCGLVMLLPHGYDGQGPEHSSARLERYLQLCAEENIQVCHPSTPAQMFHLLRRQVIRPFRRPVIVMSPKSLLRHKRSTSSLDELTHGCYQPVIDEIDPIDRERVNRLLLCSGKIYFELLEARRNNNLENIAIARIEQLYPFPKRAMDSLLSEYPNAKQVVWVQEEPRNQGAHVFLLARNHLKGRLRSDQKFSLVARPYSASPAVGYMSVHLAQQQKLISDALRLDTVTIAAQKSA